MLIFFRLSGPMIHLPGGSAEPDGIIFGVLSSSLGCFWSLSSSSSDDE